MSGGVDSSLSAALLKEQGYDVTGVYMKNWTQNFAGFECPWEQDITDANAVAAQLDLPFEVFDFQKEYKQKVVDYMLAEYQAGRTPNPDVMCNQEIKFKVFLETALEKGADFIATGHYARSQDGKLLKGVDASKDQSYFLYRVPEKALRRTLMPIGEMKKTAVREEAKKRGLVTAEKEDSQGICFVGEVGIRSFLDEYVTDITPGPIVDQNGVEVGQHSGAIYYTIGQRQGLGVGGGLPYYVVKKDMDTNTIFVTTDLDDQELWSSEFAIKDIHWINDQPEIAKKYEVAIRYRSKTEACELLKPGDEQPRKSQRTADVTLKLYQPLKAITPGQSAVIYEGDRVVGGGIITDVKHG